MADEDDMGTHEWITVGMDKFFKHKEKLENEHHNKMMQRLHEQDKLVRQRRQMEVLTRVPQMGGGLGLGMGFLQNIVSSKMMGFERLKELQSKEKTDILTKEEAGERDMLAGNKRSNSLFQKLDRTFEKHFGGNSKWNKFFGGQGKAAALGMGAGVAAGGMMLGKAIIDSSPMFQQMLKLLNFGIMMILRPIGDFFGFLLRPIMIMLLRKFIIPFYQQYLPIMQEMGDYIGNIIAPVLEKILLGVGGILKIIYGLSPLALIAGHTQEYVQGGLADLKEALGGTLDANVTTPEIRDIGTKVSDKLDSVGQAIETGKYSATGAALNRLENAPETRASNVAMDALATKISDWTVFMSKHLTKDGLMKVGRYTTEAHAGLKEGKFSSVDEAMGFFAQSMFKGGINAYAKGGIISEPVVGIGKSGQGYLLGEAGAERVSPIGDTANNVTINIYGGVDEGTIGEFERKVLDVLNRSNSRRGN
tara:strand:- start:4599 stop:6026 length:1428 start_codon:yes stop_codon:yes gene_type:complete